MEMKPPSSPAFPKVNAAGVMPIIFASSILALPSTIARFMNNESIMNFARAVAPGGNIYIPLNVTMIAFFNYFYTFLQLDPNDVSEQLKKQGASIPGIRPGKSTEGCCLALQHPPRP